jgi:hypothetical protein
LKKVNTLSDLANSCEHLSSDKTCTLISENPNAKAFRQLKCENDQNITCCCYLCLLRSQCATSCKYLGQSGNYFEQHPLTEITDPNPVQRSKDNHSQLEKVPVAFCFSCNAEMSCAKTNFTVDNWQGKSPGIVSNKVLLVTVLLCLKCGKIEFKADITREEVM